jgi:hypothetical protein
VGADHTRPAVVMDDIREQVAVEVGDVPAQEVTFLPLPGRISRPLS